MSNSSLALLLLLVLAAGGGGYWYYSQSSTPEVALTPQGTNPGPGPATEQPAEGPAAAPESATTTEPRTPAQPTRTEAAVDNANEEAAQGVKGRVLLPSGQPAAGIQLYLMESMMNDPIRVFLMAKSGETVPPTSWCKTAADGTFALGTDEMGKTYDLRAVSEEHPELNHKGIKVLDWFDTGDLQLDPGVVLQGRVLDEFTQAGVANATVYLEQTNQMHIALPTPGRERGLIALTDAQGSFVIRNAPADSAVTLTAEAPGYASGQVKGRELTPGAPIQITISRGQPIAGVVVDGSGEPLSGVQIQATGLSKKTMQVATTVTGRDGVFQFASLREGPYELKASSGTHADVQLAPVVTGDTAVKLVLVQRPWVKLKVLAANGQPVKVYRVSLKRHFPGNQIGIGNVPDFKDISVNPSYYPASLGGDWAAIRGLPNGQYRFQLTERNHAKSLSEPFTVEEGADPAEVVAQLTLGAAIVGKVVDDAGQPVRGAAVTTDMNNAFSGDGGIFDLFRSMMPEKHTKAQVKTDAQGEFRIGRLAFAEYMVRISHPDFCLGESFDITLAQEGQVVDVGVVQLMRGALVEGFTTLQGQAMGQVKVTLSVPQDENQPTTVSPEEGSRGQPKTARMPFSATAVSTNEGTYRLLKRVPPGRYKISAARQAGDQNPFNVLLDMKETERVIEVQPGVDRIKVDFELPAR